jgi:hypothetical protein
MPHILTKLRIDEVSCVIKGANPGAEVLIRKSDDDDPPYTFNAIMKRKANEPRSNDDIQRTNTEEDDKKLSERLKEIVDAMVIAKPGLHPQRALRYLLHTPPGRELLNLAINKTEKDDPPMLNIANMNMSEVAKIVSITEEALMAQVTKRDDETYAKAFSKKYENDIEFRKQWKIAQEGRHLLSMASTTKSMASLEPTSTEVGNTNVVDDSAEAIRLLNEMAEKQHRTFEQVLTDPNNKALAGRTYTMHHRPSTSSTSGSELQR